MTRAELLAALELLSSLESWGFSNKMTFPDYILEDLIKVQETLRREVLR